MSLLKVNEVQNYNGSSLTLTASTVSTSAQLNTGGNISVTGSINVSDDSTTRSNLGLGSIATQAADSVNIDGGTIDGTTIGGTSATAGTFTTFTSNGIDDNASSTALTIDSSGNVGIGTTLSGNSANNLTIRKDSQNNVVDTLLLNNGSVDNQAGTGVRINMSGVSEANSDIRCSYIESATESTGNDHYIAFGTNAAGSSPIERMRIDKSGAVTMPAVYSDTVTGRDLYISSTGQLGYVSSIRNAKINISNLELVNWLYSLNPVSFQYRTKDEEDNYTDIPEEQIEYGLIAEEVETVNSDLVFYDETENGLELRGVQYSRLISPLIKAVQQQKALIELQQSQIDALTARIEALEATP